MFKINNPGYSFKNLNIDPNLLNNLMPSARFKEGGEVNNDKDKFSRNLFGDFFNLKPMSSNNNKSKNNLEKIEMGYNPFDNNKFKQTEPKLITDNKNLNLMDNLSNLNSLDTIENLSNIGNLGNISNFIKGKTLKDFHNKNSLINSNKKYESLNSIMEHGIHIPTNIPTGLPTTIPLKNPTKNINNLNNLFSMYKFKENNIGDK